MSKRMVLLLGICLFGTMGIAKADDVQPFAQAGYSAAASWVTPNAEMSVEVGNRGDGTPLDTWAYITVFRFGCFCGGVVVIATPAKGGSSGASRSRAAAIGEPVFWGNNGCEAAVKLQSGQMQTDTTLGSATLSIPSTPCGAVNVSWTAVGDPQPVTNANADQSPLEYAYSQASIGITRAADASGSIGSDNATVDQLERANLSFGVSAGAFFDQYPVFASSTLFKGVSVEVHKGRTIGRVFGYEYLARGSAGSWGNGATGNEYYGCVELFTPMPIHNPKAHFVVFSGAFRCGYVTLTLDPTLATGEIIAKFGSVSADVTFTSSSSATPGNNLAPAPSPSPSDPLPSFIAGGSIFESRVATATGYVKSKFNSLTLNQPDAQLVQGANAELWHGYPFYYSHPKCC
ncbi:MAG: hypothetical protein ACYDCC_12230 [Actinomycetota bacterium]